MSLEESKAERWKEGNTEREEEIESERKTVLMTRDCDVSRKKALLG